jgi:hypothetical protein
VWQDCVERFKPPFASTLPPCARLRPRNVRLRLTARHGASEGGIRDRPCVGGATDGVCAKVYRSFQRDGATQRELLARG